jgi:AAHS family cis,cis-muconate transporter-like MFS transporter
MKPGERELTAQDSMTNTGKMVSVAVFTALVVDGMDLQMLALALPSIMKELNISTVLAGALGTYTLMGMGIGGAFAGWMSDRYGRVRVTWWSILTFSICTGLIGLCREYWQIGTMRFISGFGIAGLYSVGSLLASEYVPSRIRTTVLGILQAGWSVGYVIAALSSSYIIPAFGWRPLFFCAIPPGVVSLLLLRGLTEPPSWAAAHKAAREAGPKRNEFVQIWENEPIRRTFLLWSLTAIALQFGYYGANTWLPSYLVKDLGVNLKNMGWYVAATYTMMVVGKVITGYLADKFGRRLMWTVAGLVTAIYLPVVIYVATPSTVGYLLLIFGFLYGAPYAINATYLSESFPTSVRGTAVAAAYNIGRVGSTLSPLMIGFVATTYSVGFGIALLGVSYGICGLIPGLFIRERMYDPKAVQQAEVKTALASS